MKQKEELVKAAQQTSQKLVSEAEKQKANLVSKAGKFFAGTISGSIAVTADAFNNLSDAGSSVVTLLGFRLAGRKPDPEHPFGHGRMEYLSGLAVSYFVITLPAILVSGLAYITGSSNLHATNILIPKNKDVKNNGRPK